MEESLQENLYLNRSELNVEKLIKERKVARLYIFFASVGVLAGISASLMFFFKYKLLTTPSFALISGTKKKLDSKFTFKKQYILHSIL